MNESENTLALIAALVAGDRWLDADATAAHLGMFTKGKINRRGFLERVACLPDFPAPLVIGQEKKWRKSQVDEWALEQQRAKRSA